MTIENRLSHFYNKITFLLPQLRNINVKNLNSLPAQIDTMIIGRNKISELANGSIQEVTEEDLNGITTIGYYAFSNCRSLTNIIIPDSVVSIGRGALTSTGYDNDENNWENGLLYIDNCLVYIKRNYSSYEIKPGTRLMADEIFQNCNKLVSIVIPGSIANVSVYAFSGCNNLTDVIMRSGVTSIGNRAFNGCTSLTSIIIPDSVTSIGDHVFGNCTSLTSIEIPDSVTSIGDHVFRGCTNLESITFGDGITSIGMYTLEGCSKLTSVTIGDNVTKIGNAAFSGCTSLTSITIPDSVTSISVYAFRGCTNLTNIYLNPTNPPILNSPYDTIPSTTTIHVPVGSGDAYKSATNWSRHSERIVEDIVLS